LISGTAEAAVGAAGGEQGVLVRRGSALDLVHQIGETGFEKLRPTQQTVIAGLVVAGDWTDTTWPATMEGAVRSGYLAAEAILHAADRPQKFLRPDLPRGLLARLLLRT